MTTIVVRLADLQFLSPADLAGELSDAELAERIRAQFAYLGGEVQVEIQVGIATIGFVEASAPDHAEAHRLFNKGGKRAKNGEFQKAKAVFQRVLELDPAMAEARRDLAMTMFELGEMSEAKDELIDALRLQPDDAWSYVILGNIYVKHDQDFATAARFFRRALELKPGDPYALNSLAAVSSELGESAEALRCFDEAIATHPQFANAWLGKAMLLQKQDQPHKVIEVLEVMFRRAEAMDARSVPVFAEARRVYFAAQHQSAESLQSDVFKELETYKADIAALTGYPVKVERRELSGQLSGVAQMAWKRGRDHHLVQLSERLPAPDRQHVEAHELTHIRLEGLARRVAKNRWFITTAASREFAIRSLAADVKKLERKGYAEESITRVVFDLVSGLSGAIFNTPLDMLIETYLHREMPSLRHAQIVSLARLAQEALAATTHPEIRKLTPPKILRATVALNGAAALFVDEFSGGATEFWPKYQRLDGANVSPRLIQLWKDRCDTLGAGDEYDLVDSFAELLGLRGWYEWKADPGTHDVQQEPVREGTTNPELLREKYPAAVWFLLDALNRYARLATEEVRTIAFEIAMVGRSGLDYASSEKKYSLKSIPGERFSGLQLMCLMHAGFKRLNPELDTGMDLHEPFLQALALFNAGSKPG